MCSEGVDTEQKTEPEWQAQAWCDRLAKPQYFRVYLTEGGNPVAHVQEMSTPSVVDASKSLQAILNT